MTRMWSMDFVAVQGDEFGFSPLDSTQPLNKWSLFLSSKFCVLFADVLQQKLSCANCDKERYANSDAVSTIAWILLTWAGPKFRLDSEQTDFGVVSLWALVVVVQGSTTSHHSNSFYTKYFAFSFFLGTSCFGAVAGGLVVWWHTICVRAWGNSCRITNVAVQSSASGYQP